MSYVDNFIGKPPPPKGLFDSITNYFAGEEEFMEPRNQRVDKDEGEKVEQQVEEPIEGVEQQEQGKKI